MNRWFRVYDDVLDDPKVQRLQPELFKAWINVLCLASKNDGALPPIEDCAFGLRMTAGGARETLDALAHAGLIDIEVDKSKPHNWDKRQFQSDRSTPRVQRFRHARRNVSSTVSETPPETETETETEKKEKRARARASFDRFWSVWPNKVQKLYAEKCFAKVADQIDAIVDGVERYIRDKPPDRPWLNPSTFLNQQRWKDRPAPTGGKSNGKGSIVEAGRRLTERLVAAERERELQGVNRVDDGDPAVRLLPGFRRERP